MSGTIASAISDHLAIFICLQKCSVKRLNRKLHLSCQNINIDHLENFRRDMLNADLSDMCLEADANKAYDPFLKIFKRIYQKHFPYRHLKTKKGSRKPLVIRELLGKIHYKTCRIGYS